MKKNLVFIINSSFPVNSGGKETWLYNIIIRLEKLYNINVVSRKNNNKSFFKINPEINIKKIFRYKFLPIRYVGGLSVNVMQNNIFALIAANYIRKNFNYNNTIIICVGSGYESLVGFILKKYGFRYISSVRGKWPEAASYGSRKTEENFYKEYFLNLNKKNLNNADLIITNGWDTRDYIFKYISNRAKKRTHVLPNGVDFLQFHNNKITKSLNISEDIILSVSTLRVIKGIRYIINSIPRIVKDNKNVKFVFAGKGGQHSFMQLAIKLGVSDYVIFLCERKDIPNLLKQSKISLCVSGGSGISHTALESLASGVSVVAWDTPVYQQLIKDGENGLLVKEHDTKSLAKAILLLLKNKKLRNKFKVNGPQTVRKYDYKNIASRFLNEIEET